MNVGVTKGQLSNMKTENVSHGKDYGHNHDLDDGHLMGNTSHPLIITSITPKNRVSYEDIIIISEFKRRRVNVESHDVQDDMEDSLMGLGNDLGRKNLHGVGSRFPDPPSIMSVLGWKCCELENPQNI